jgi:4-hydroxybenzoate polyprenyltransferase
VSVATIAVLAAALAVAAFALSFALLPKVFLLALGVYLAGTLLYSTWLKARLLVDVFLLAGLYTLRVLAGGAAASLPVTPWLLAFSSFLFLSLAFVKRYAELIEAGRDDAEFVKARNYRQEDMAILESVGPTSGYLAVLVLAIYISTDLARQLYHHPQWLWLLCPVVLYWITRIWFLARRRALSEDPILFALTDRISWIAGGVAAAIVIGAARQWW